MIVLSEKEYILRTPDAGNTQIYDFNWIVTCYKWLDFAIMGCGNAHIALCQSAMNYTQNCYEVVIGSYGNSAVEIRNGPGVSVPTSI